MIEEGSMLEMGRLAELGLLGASMIHELRQPLFTVKALLDLIHAESLGGTTGPRLLLLRREVGHLEEIVARYGTLSRRPEPCHVPMDPSELAREAAAVLEHHALRQGSRIEVLFVDPPLMLRAEPVGLRQALVNLLHNALDAVKSHEQTSVSLLVGRQGEELLFEVSDSGCGISESDMSRIFEPFFTTKPAGLGTGLGLPIVRETVLRHGGRVELDSSPLGTRVRILIPLEREP